MPWRAMASPFLAASTNCRSFNDKTGKTQGMRFRMIPPTNAKKIAVNAPSEGAFETGTAGTGAAAGTPSTPFVCAAAEA